MKHSTRIALLPLAAAVTAGSATPALAADAQTDARIERLEAVNQALIDYLRANSQGAQADALVAKLNALQAEPVPQAPPPPPPPPVAAAQSGTSGEASWADSSQDGGNRGLVGFNSTYSYRMLDHAENINTRPLILLQARLDDELDTRVTFGGAVTVIADSQNSNRDSKFGYLMRHPTQANQTGAHSSEATIHAAQIQATIAFAPSLSGYVEMIYNPEQSFGAGTLTDINRNQVEVRKAFLLYGNLKNSPIYAAIGKMDVPFGQNDTVSPFTNSTNWHAFAPLAYGAMAGYYDHGFHVRAMAVQGGAQFRGANAPVRGTATPSKLNNFAVDANYTATLGENFNVLAGGSYIHGSAYCQGYPVTHFKGCADNVPAWAAYGNVNFGRLKLLGEFARTTKVWPGTQVPAVTNPLSQFAASRVTSFTVGGRYAAPIIKNDVNVSFEFSQFRAGADGAPWERQNQWVAGLAHRVLPSVDLFGEFIRTEGYAPLNFVSGGNFPDGSTWSDRDARSNVIMLGMQAAF